MILLQHLWNALLRGLMGARDPLSRVMEQRPERKSSNETTIFITRRHPIVAIVPIWAPVLGAIVVIWTRSKTPGSGPLDAILLAGEGLLVLRWLWQVWEWRRETFSLTTRRVMLVYGILTQRRAMMPTSKVTDLTYVRSPLGDLLNYGHVIIESAGQDQALREIRYLPHPTWVFRQMDALLFGVDDPAASVE